MVKVDRTSALPFVFIDLGAAEWFHANHTTHRPGNGIDVGNWGETVLSPKFVPRELEGTSEIVADCRPVPPPTNEVSRTQVEVPPVVRSHVSRIISLFRLEISQFNLTGS